MSRSPSERPPTAIQSTLPHCIARPKSANQKAVAARLKTPFIPNVQVAPKFTCKRLDHGDKARPIRAQSAQIRLSAPRWAQFKAADVMPRPLAPSPQVAARHGAPRRAKRKFRQRLRNAGRPKSRCRASPATTRTPIRRLRRRQERPACGRQTAASVINSAHSRALVDARTFHLEHGLAEQQLRALVWKRGAARPRYAGANARPRAAHCGSAAPPNSPCPRIRDRNRASPQR